MIRVLIIFVVFVNCTHGDFSNQTEQQTRNDLNDTTQSTRNQLLQNLYKIVQNNYENATTDDESNDQFPMDALNGIYVECILALSYPCLQKKMINFLYKLDKMKNIDLIGKSVVVVRKPEPSLETTVLAKIAQYVDQSYLKDIIDHLIDKFFDNHVLRVKIPSYFEENSNGANETRFLDIDFGVQQTPVTSREGRSRHRHRHRRRRRRRRPHHHHHGDHHGDHHGGGHKKMLMMMGLMMCMKMSMMGPLLLGLVGLKAMKAIILATMSITMSKMMMLGKSSHSSHLSSMLSGGGGHDGGYGGYGGYGASNGGWDRTIHQEQLASTSSLPYHIEPPAPHNSYTVH